MTEFGVPAEAEHLFDLEYWGGETPETVPPSHYILGSKFSRQHAKAMLAPLVDGVVNGTQEGSQLAAGVVFDASDQDLSMVPHHFFGTVLLSDVETLYLGSKTKRNEATARQDYADTHLLDVSPRQLIRAKSQYIDHTPRLINRATTGLTNDEGQLYIRAVTLWVIGQSRGGKGMVHEMQLARMRADETGEGLVARIVLMSRPLPGMTVKEPHQMMSQRTGEPVLYRRLRSLEIIAAGERVPAKAPKKLFSFFGKTAFSQ